MTTTDRTHEPDETFRAVLDRIEAAPEAHTVASMLNRTEADVPAYHREPMHPEIAHKCSLLGDPFRAEGEPGVAG